LGPFDVRMICVVNLGYLAISVPTWSMGQI